MKLQKLISAVGLSIVALTAVSCSGGATVESTPSPPSAEPSGDPFAPQPLADRTTVTIASASRAEQYLAVLLADSRGEFDKENIDVEFIIAPPTDQVAGLASGQLDAAATSFSLSALNAISSGVDLAVVLAIAGRGEGDLNGWWIRKEALGDDGEFQPSDLVGKRVGSPSDMTGTSPAFLFMELLREDPDFDMDSVEVIQMSMPDGAQAVMNNAVDMTFSALPFWPPIQESDCCVFIDHWTDLPSGLLWYGRNLLEEPEVGAAVVRAIARTMQQLDFDYHADPDIRREMIEVLGTTEEAIEAGAPNRLATDFILPVEYMELQRYYRLLAGAMSYEEDLAADEVFDDQFVAPLREAL